MELESKYINLKDRQIFIQKNINNLIRSIEDIGAAKINVCILLIDFDLYQ